MTFQEACFPDYVVNILQDYAITQPMPIQSAGWPVVMSGHDFIGIAQTGSGKTLSFILPALVHIKAQPKLE